MARFRFSLQAVLSQRERVERERQRAVAVLETQRRALEDSLRGHQRGIVEERGRQWSFLAGGDLHSARHQAAAAGQLDAAARRVVVELAGVHRRLERAREELVEAMKQRRAMELLRERRYEEWKQEERRREAAAVDELAVMRASHQE